MLWIAWIKASHCSPSPPLKVKTVSSMMPPERKVSQKMCLSIVKGRTYPRELWDMFSRRAEVSRHRGPDTSLFFRKALLYRCSSFIAILTHYDGRCDR